MQLLSKQTDQSLEILEAERDRLQTSCAHLQRSNCELKEAIRDAGPDEEFQQDIEVPTGALSMGLQKHK